jgi:hypothetical protein
MSGRATGARGTAFTLKEVYVLLEARRAGRRRLAGRARTGPPTFGNRAHRTRCHFPNWSLNATITDRKWGGCPIGRSIMNVLETSETAFGRIGFLLPNICPSGCRVNVTVVKSFLETGQINFDASNRIGWSVRLVTCRVKEICVITRPSGCLN